MRPEALSNHPDASQADVPLSPEVERIRRKLMRLMMVVLAITFMLVVAVLIAVIYKATQQPKQTSIAPPPPISPAISTEYELDLDAHTRLVSHLLNDPIITFETLASDGNREFIFYDYRQGRVISRLKILSRSE